MINRYKNKDMNRIFNGYIDAFRNDDKKSPFFTEPKNSSLRRKFWEGYGLIVHFTIPAKGTNSYAAYMAGKYCKDNWETL